MYDESTGINSAANILELRKECYKIINDTSYCSLASQFPNVKALADEYLAGIDTQEICRLNKLNKIVAIKMVKTKYGLSLTDSKILVDEHFKRLGY